MPFDLIEIQHFAQKCLNKDTTGHDYYHVDRVAHIAASMYQNDYPDTNNTDALVIIQIASYLHDTIDEKITNDIDRRIQEITNLKTMQRLSKSARENILDIIQNMSFLHNIEHHHQLSLEGQYVQDADRIEALGAIGIARAFTYGGQHHNPIYDPKIPATKLTSHKQYRTKTETTINHFDEKLFQLEKTMNTASGRQLAHQRTLIMRQFVNQFMDEWELNDFQELMNNK